MVTRLIIVRHCETEGNATKIFQGRIDTPLSQMGIFQLGLVAARLSKLPIDCIYTSPQPRAQKTARAINGFHNVPVFTEDGLREMWVGEMDGMYCGDIARKFPQESKIWDEAPWDFASPGGETMGQVYERASLAAQHIVQGNPGKTVLLTAHGCLIRNLLCWCSGLPLSSLAEIPLGANTAVSIVGFCEDGSKKVELLSDCSHLPPETYDPKRQFKLMAFLEKKE